MTTITKIAIQNWNDSASVELQKRVLENLENGDVILFPSLQFKLHENEKSLLTPDILQKGRKNVSLNATTCELKGIDLKLKNKTIIAQQMMQRYYENVKSLISQLLPTYQNDIHYGRTSYRPAEIFSRKPLSTHKDDRLLHVDAFPASPVANQRILRVFTNINPNDEPRRWRLGKSFEEVIERYLEKIPKPIPATRKFKHWLGLTRNYQTLYDHYMLKLHHTMKCDALYQNNYPDIYDFLPNTTWMVYTDTVPHAAMGGQFLLEQTIYVPIEAMQQPEKSPLKLMEKKLNQPLLA